MDFASAVLTVGCISVVIVQTALFTGQRNFTHGVYGVCDEIPDLPGDKYYSADNDAHGDNFSIG